MVGGDRRPPGELHQSKPVLRHSPAVQAVFDQVLKDVDAKTWSASTASSPPWLAVPVEGRMSS
jgi:hypothetical protein